MSEGKVSGEDAVRGTMALLEEATKMLHIGNEQNVSPMPLSGKANDEVVSGKVNEILKKKSVEVGAATVLASSASVPGIDTFSKMVFGVAASSSIIKRIRRKMVREIAQEYGENLSSDEAKQLMPLLDQSTPVPGKEEEKVSVEMTRALMRAAVAYAVPHAVFARASLNMVVTYVVGKRTKAYFEKGESGLNTWNEDMKALTGFDRGMLIEWEKEALVVLMNDVAPNIKKGGLKTLLKVVQSDTGQQIAATPVGKGLEQGGKLVAEGGKALLKSDIGNKMATAAVEGGKAIAKYPRVKAAVQLAVKGAVTANKNMKDE